MRDAAYTGTWYGPCYLALNGKYLAKIVREDSNPSQTYFLHADMVGSIRAITDSAGEVVARFGYEPFGLLTMSTGPMAAGAPGFTGKPEDGATGLYYFGARHYDSGVGRFLSRDPIYYGSNWYSYCSSSPLAYYDPNGLREEPGTGSGVIQSEAELLIVETQEDYPGFIWGSRNQAPFHTQFFAWLQEHPEERARVFPKWSLKLGASVSIWPYGVASQVDTSTGEWGFGKTLSAQQLWGVSIDVELSRKLSVADPRVELAVGANKHMSVGSLWDLNEGGGTSWAGLALHGGLGYGLPINLTIPIPKHAPPFAGSL
ncbi:MAG: RHS repeat-associated core domain-containing protein [Clostridia bacterium]|nr:RHS repeat-associated core domain-containing protein [Clostridia bacterium]